MKETKRTGDDFGSHCPLSHVDSISRMVARPLWALVRCSK
jgi:hydrogenase/urease accessory protein HupE